MVEKENNINALNNAASLLTGSSSHQERQAKLLKPAGRDPVLDSSSEEEEANAAAKAASESDSDDEGDTFGDARDG